MNLFTMLTVLFVALKLTNFIDWSWWWVWSPLVIGFLWGVFVFGLAATVTRIVAPTRRRRW